MIHFAVFLLAAFVCFSNNQAEAAAAEAIAKPITKTIVCPLLECPVMLTKNCSSSTGAADPCAKCKSGQKCCKGCCDSFCYAPTPTGKKCPKKSGCGKIACPLIATKSVCRKLDCDQGESCCDTCCGVQCTLLV